MADTKASAFTTTTTMASTDVFPVITGIGGTPANKIISKSALKTDLALVKGDVGLGNVDNTSDTNKPVSTAQATADALNLKIASNLSDLASTSTARTNLGVPAGSGTSTGTNTGDQTLPTNAAGTDLDTATDTTKFATAKAIKDAHNVPSVAPSTSGNVLTSNGTDWTSAAPAGGGGGQTLVTKVVAASGGDYTTLGAALTAASDGWVIHVYPGTYTESAITSSKANVTIVGAGAESSILSFSSNALTMSGTLVRFINVGLTFSTGGAIFSGTYSEVIGCHVYQTSVSSTSLINFSGASGNLKNSYLNRPVDSTGYCVQSGFYFTMTGNRVESGQDSNGELLDAGGFNNIVGNTFRLTSGGNGGTAVINLAGAQTTFTGNNVLASSFGAGQLLFSNSGDLTISGNYFHGGSTSTIGVWTRGSDSTISSNTVHLRSASCKGINLSGPSTVVTGNIIEFDSSTSTIGINLVNGAGADTCVITGNRIDGSDKGIVITSGTNTTLVVANSVTGYVTSGVADSGTASVVANNAV